MFLRAIIILSLLFGATCAEVRQEPPEREPIAIQYVVTPELQIHQKPLDTSAVVSTYRHGESVSILSTQDEWAEVRLGSGGSGWARRDGLARTKESGEFDQLSGNVSFHVPPNPVYSNRKIAGEIVIEASVNTDGDIFAIRTVRNTTGSPELEAENKAALLAAKFNPMVIGGRPRPFVYEYRVSY